MTKKIAVIGMGYVGLSNAILLAQNNYVYAVDIDEEKINYLKDRISPVRDEMICEYLKCKSIRLHPTQDIKFAVSVSEIVILAVPTNYDDMIGGFDTSVLDRLIKEISRINDSCLIIVKSTVPIGYVERIIMETNNKNIAFSPEFLREGNALYDNLYPSRIVIGCSNDIHKEVTCYADEMINAVLKPNVPIFFMGTREAEAVKLFSNTYLAMRVAFFNELDTFAEQNNLNMSDILPAMGTDNRIGNYYNNPSFGFGGYCLPKDTKQMNMMFNHNSNRLIAAVMDSNEERIRYIAKQLINKYDILNGKKIVGIYRIVMKNNSDNFRESSTIALIHELRRYSLQIIIYEPLLEERTCNIGNVINDLSMFKAIADVIVANRYDIELNDVIKKVYTRDITHCD